MRDKKLRIEGFFLRDGIQWHLMAAQSNDCLTIGYLSLTPLTALTSEPSYLCNYPTYIHSLHFITSYTALQPKSATSTTEIAFNIVYRPSRQLLKILYFNLKVLLAILLTNWKQPATFSRHIVKNAHFYSKIIWLSFFLSLSLPKLVLKLYIIFN